MIQGDRTAKSQARAIAYSSNRIPELDEDNDDLEHSLRLRQEFFGKQF